MTFAEEVAKDSREPTTVLRINTDQCDNEFGVAPCTASGSTCFFTFKTCKDRGNYINTTGIDRDFCNNAGFLVPGCHPYIGKAPVDPTKIDAKRHVTALEIRTFNMVDDTPPTPLANPQKLLSRTESGNSFWKNWLARNPNFRGREVTLYEGFSNLSFPSEYEITFKGFMTNVTTGEGRATIECKDFMKKLELKVPTAQSSTNVLDAQYSGASTMKVIDVSKFDDNGVVFLEDDDNGNEYVTYTSKNNSNDTLMGCIPGRYGSDSVSHPVGTKVRNALAFADPETGEGIPADDCLHKLLFDLGRISAANMAVLDKGVSVLSATTATAETMEISGSTSEFPDSGYVKVNDEVIRYSSIANAPTYGTVDSEPGPHALDFDMKGVEGTTKIAFRFTTAPGDTRIDRFSFTVKKSGAALSGRLDIDVFTDVAGSPGVVFRGLTPIGGIPLTFFSQNYTTFTVERRANLVAATDYWMVFTPDGWSTFPSGLSLQFSSDNAGGGSLKRQSANSSSWIAVAGTFPLFTIEKITGSSPQMTIERGQLQTTAAAHADGDAVEISMISNEVFTWLPGVLYRRYVTKSISLAKLLIEFRQSTLFRVWQGEDTKINARAAPVPRFGNQVVSFTDAASIIHQSIRTDENDKDRITRVIIHHTPSETHTDPGTSVDNYRSTFAQVDLEAESDDSFGEIRSVELFAPWIISDAAASLVSSHHLMRFRAGARKLTLATEMKDLGLLVGGFVRVSTDAVVNPDGSPVSQELYEVMSKKREKMNSNKFIYELLVGSQERYAVISATSVIDDYDDYPESDHLNFAWISDGNGEVGAAKATGYAIS